MVIKQRNDLEFYDRVAEQWWNPTAKIYALYHLNLPRFQYEDNSFDAAICVDVLEHVSDLQQTISEIYRILKPGGFFGFDTINRTFKSKLVMIWLLEDILPEIPQGIHDWQKFIKPEELRQLMDENGFGDFDLKGFNVFGAGILAKIAAYMHYKKTGSFKISINEDLSVMYIGKAEKKLK